VEVVGEVYAAAGKEQLWSLHRVDRRRQDVGGVGCVLQ
jgi:hypothetical protein